MKKLAQWLWDVGSKVVAGLLVILTCWIAGTLRNLEIAQAKMAERVENLATITEVRMVWAQEELEELGCRVADIESKCHKGVGDDYFQRDLRGTGRLVR